MSPLVLALAVFVVVLGLLVGVSAMRSGSAPAPVPPAAPAEAKEPAEVELRDFTVEELKEFDGAGGKPIYVALDGVVFDVSSHESGRRMYGAGSGYSMFAGIDASVALGKMELKPEKVAHLSIDDLDEDERNTLNEWVRRRARRRRERRR